MLSVLPGPASEKSLPYCVVLAEAGLMRWIPGRRVFAGRAPAPNAEDGVREATLKLFPPLGEKDFAM